MSLKLLYEQEGVSDNEAEVIKLSYKDYEKVECGDIIAELETSKTVVEITTSKSGFVKNVAKLNDFVKAGDIIAIVGDNIEELKEVSSDDAPIVEKKKNKPSISAKALKIAKNANISIETIEMFKITSVNEINDYIKNINKEKNLETNIKKDTTINSDLVAKFNEEDISKNKLTEITNLKFAQLNTVPSTCSVIVEDFDIASFSKRNDLHFNNIFPVIAEICAKELKVFKNLNGFFYNNKKYIYEDINIGFTVDINDCVQVPVVHNCDKYNRKDLRNKYLELFSTLVKNKISVSQLSKPTFIISDLSSVGDCFFHTPLLAPYTSGILGLAIDKRNSRLVITLTYDHQMSSGKEALNFLESLIVKADFLNKL